MNVLLLYGDPPDRTETRVLGEAYERGAREAGAVVRSLNIIDLKFNPNIPLGHRVTDLEPDMDYALKQLHWATHVVLFCTVYKDTIPARLKGFFDRLFLPDRVFPEGLNNDFRGKSARIVSMLDQASWASYKEDKLPAYHSVKRMVFERRGFHPVRTATVGVLHSIDNEYAKKWLGKMTDFGVKLI